MSSSTASRPQGRRVALLELVVVGVLLLNIALVVGIAGSLIRNWDAWTRAPSLPEQGSSMPLAHPPAPTVDPAAAQNDTCERMRGLFASLDGQLQRAGGRAPVSADEVERIVGGGHCLLDDPLVRDAFERYRNAFDAAGVEAPPLLPHLED